jgi:hypothetical protein
MIHDNDEVVQPASGEDRRVSSSKRALLKAGWIAPAVVALSLPMSSSYAANISGNKDKDKDKEKDKDKDKEKDKEKDKDKD